MICQIKTLHAKIAEPNLSLMKVNKLSTKKKDLRTNHRDALIVAERENNSATTMAAAADTIATVTGKPTS